MSRTYRAKEIRSGIPESFGAITKKLGENTFVKSRFYTSKGYNKFEFPNKRFPEFMFPLIDFINSIEVTYEIIRQHPIYGTHEKVPRDIYARYPFSYSPALYIFVPIKTLAIDKEIKSFMFANKKRTSVYDGNVNYFHNKEGCWLNILPLIKYVPEKNYVKNDNGHILEFKAPRYIFDGMPKRWGRYWRSKYGDNISTQKRKEDWKCKKLSNEFSHIQETLIDEFSYNQFEEMDFDKWVWETNKVYIQ